MADIDALIEQPYAQEANTPRVYSYTRFSTLEQAGGDSKRRQRDGALRWIERKNTERAARSVPPLVLDERLTLADLGVSAYRGANTATDGGLGGFLTACREGMIEPGSYLLVESLDRVSRMTPRRVSRLLDDIVDAGVIVATLGDGQEYDADRLDNDPTALLIALMVSWRAHEESKVKGQRLASAWAEKRRRVRNGDDAKLTAKGPSWLLWTAEGWQERQPHGDTVRRVYQMTLDGVGEHKIAKTFNSESVAILGRGKMWHRSTVSKLLRTEAVIGTLVPGHMDHTGGKTTRILEAPITGAFPAVISDADWYAVRAIKDGKAPAVRGRGAVGVLSNVFAGLARCPECGATMTRVTKGSSTRGGAAKLVCTKAKAGAASHGYRSIHYAMLERAFVDSWQSLLADMPAGEMGGRLDADCENLASVIAVTEDNLADLSRRYDAEPNQANGIKVRGLQASLVSYRTDLVTLERNRSLADHGLAVSRLEALSNAIAPEEPSVCGGLEVAKVNAALRSLFDGVVIDYQAGCLRFQWRQGGEARIGFAWPEGI